MAHTGYDARSTIEMTWALILASARQVALAFLTRIPAVFAIPKAASPEHTADNAAAGNLRLSEGEITVLDKAFPRGPKPRSLPML